MKARIGNSFDKKTKTTLYQLQFKLDGERTYNAYSYDMFKTEAEAKVALEKHESGTREYKYCRSVEKVKRTQKGNSFSIEKKVAFHVMEASPNIDGALIWAKID